MNIDSPQLPSPDSFLYQYIQLLLLPLSEFDQKRRDRFSFMWISQGKPTIAVEIRSDEQTDTITVQFFEEFERAFYTMR
jgi:hypothetical protein